MTAAASLTVAAALTTTWAVAQHEEQQTPCQVSNKIIADVRKHIQDGNGYAVTHVGADYANLMRGIADGRYEDVASPATEPLHSELYALARDFESPYSVDSGDLEQRMDMVLLFCRS